MNAAPTSQSTLYQTFRHLSRDVRLYMLASAIVGFTIFGGIETVILNLYLLRLGYGSRFIGWVNATGALTNTLIALPLGLLGLRVSRRRMMMTGMLTMATGMGALPFAEYLPGHLTRVWLLVTRGIGYLGMGVFQIGGTPFLIGATRPGERNQAYAFHTAIGPLAGLAGGLVGGLLPSFFAGLAGVGLSDTGPYRQTLWTTALFLIPGFFLVRATTETHPAQQLRTERRNSSVPLIIFVLIFLSGFLQLAGERVARTYFNVYMDMGFQTSPSFIGSFWSMGHCLSVATALLSPYLCKRWGIVNVSILGAFGMVTSLLLMTWLTHPYAVGLAFVSLIGFAAIRRPAYTVHHQELISPAWRPTMAGTTSFSAGSSEFTMALLGGYTIASVGFAPLFQTGALLTAVGAALFWLYFRTPRGERGEAVDGGQ
tara:strand:+ start:2665 stop:3945 length:1281 start_codon:yes stop_codon:yes gene_type:complete